ncbi:MAG: phosphatase PAP2 family protein [Elusimicrobia bacterium]|nr:phosphatase PAP2 family protein [Elusimicrobiota bacterium]
MKSAVRTAGALLVVAAFLALVGSRQPSQMSPYFGYAAEDVQSLRKLEPAGRMGSADLYQWDQKAFDLVSARKMGDIHAAKVYAYLATAQKDAAALSSRATGRFSGSLVPVTRDVLRLFFPQDIPPAAADPYSERLSSLVLAKVKARIAEDDRAVKPYEEKSGKQYWKGMSPYYGRDVGSWKPWNIESPAAFMAPAPPADGSPQMSEQLRQVKAALAGAAENQRKAVVFWAGGPGTKTPPGQWLEIADESLRSREVPLEKALVVRSALTRTVADAVIVVFHNKYTYWKKRPFMLDASIQTVMPTPNHPSYPAAHGMISAASAVVLSHYLPEERQSFLLNAREATDCRTWGGIHFPQDNKQGFLLGSRMADTTLKETR